MAKKKRGGPGRGQGRHAIDPDEKRVTLTITVAPSTVRLLEPFGRGRSLVIEAAILEYLERQKNPEAK